MQTWNRGLIIGALFLAVGLCSGLINLSAYSQSPATESAPTTTSENKSPEDGDDDDDDDVPTGSVQIEDEPKLSQEDDNQPVLKIFLLRYMQADDVQQLLVRLFEDELEKAGNENFKIEVIPESNNLIVKASGKNLEKIAALLEELDRTDSQAVRRPQARFTDDLTVPDRSDRILAAAATHLGRLRSNPSPEIATLEQQTKEYAVELRKLERVLKSDHPRLKERREQLRALVVAAFTARQKEQRAQLTRIRERLSSIEEQLNLRDRHSKEIIERRVQELQNPEELWESDSLASPADDQAPTSGSQEDFQPKRRQLTKPGTAESVTETAPVRAESADFTQEEKNAPTNNQPADPRITRESRLPMEPANDPRKLLMDAEIAVESAKALLEDAVAETQSEKENLDLFDSRAAQGTIPVAKILEQKKAWESARRKVNRAKTELEGRMRVAAYARELLDEQIAAARAELDTARERFQRAQDALNRLKSLAEKGVISQADVDAGLDRLAEHRAEVARWNLRLEYLAKPQADAKPESTAKNPESR
jgi:Bacterial type II/III secretion system short domain